MNYTLELDIALPRERVVELGLNRTRWIFETEFRCSGFLRIMAFLLPVMFRNASRKEMLQFKRFAEDHGTSA